MCKAAEFFLGITLGSLITGIAWHLKVPNVGVTKLIAFVAIIIVLTIVLELWPGKSKFTCFLLGCAFQAVIFAYFNLENGLVLSFDVFLGASLRSFVFTLVFAFLCLLKCRLFPKAKEEE